MSSRHICAKRFASRVPACGRGSCRKLSRRTPGRLIGDKAYDSDPLDQRLAREYGIELIAPNRQRRRKSQDGRPLRRYKKRWKVERLFAWLHNFRRLVTRWEYHIENFLGFVHLGCLKLLLKHL